MRAPADDKLFRRVLRARDVLERLEADLRRAGDSELAGIVRLARGEFMTPAFTGMENTRGVEHNGVRN